MMLDKNTVSAGILLIAIYIFAVQPLSTALASVGLSIILFVFTKSEGLVLAFMLATLFLKQYSALLAKPEPVGIEAFQTKDAASIHARLQQVRAPPPLKPAVANITGVLESPDILDNLPLQAMETLTKEGVPCTSIPASAKARVLIYPKAEGFVPAMNMSQDTPVREATYLHQGEDNEGVQSALAHDMDDMTPTEEIIPSSEFASSEPMEQI